MPRVKHKKIKASLVKFLCLPSKKVHPITFDWWVFPWKFYGCNHSLGFVQIPYFLHNRKISLAPLHKNKLYSSLLPDVGKVHQSLLVFSFFQSLRTSLSCWGFECLATEVFLLKNKEEDNPKTKDHLYDIVRSPREKRYWHT